MYSFTRREVPLLAMAAALSSYSYAFAHGPGDQQLDVWPASALLQAPALAAMLTQNDPVQIVCVAFPVLYRQRHIRGAVLAGPTSKPEGLASLQTALAPLNKADRLVLYCGCCPMVHCPNIRPAYSAAKTLGFTNVHVLNLPTNFHTDWAAKGFPT